ncbi:DUF262 domain-containing protein [Flavobacterium sp. Arc3]|uniref:GmrSD restriction endonuclease domain-containing protein n=1 Tax=Flavobacterium sp. Arc3 TaxID=3046686 RepID=UPI00352DA66E
MNKYNLIDILSKELIIEEQDISITYKFEGIQIPMIQRDYAQGRAEELEIRNRFLKSIFNALIKDENLELDFVYGSIKELDMKIHFIPLDGQQRLTTLFLLHWYIGKRELKASELDSLLTTLKGFTYATRSSARDFCEKLIDISISFKGEPKKEIANSAWFFGRFEKDPTVTAMLIMLDAIHSFYEQELTNNASINLFPSLSKLSFYILPLGGFNLSDELYIKMNARGKQLTDFENLKADLINWIRDEKNSNSKEFQNKVKLKGREMPYHLSFATKLDNSWTHLFWEYIKQYKTDTNIDIYYLRFWNRFLLNHHITSSLELPDMIEKGEVFKKLYGNGDSKVNFKYEGFDFYKQLFEKQNVISDAQHTLDGLSENFNEIQKSLQPVWAVKDSWNLFDEKINQRQRILFLAISLYLQKNTFNIDKFKNWIRVVWNIIIDPDIRSITVMINIMRIVDKLSAGSGDIYKFIAGSSLQAIIQNETSFVKAQLEEEKLKAELIIADPAWEAELILAEKHQLFQGNIGFLLLNKPDIKSFKHRLGISQKFFSSKGTKDSLANEHILIRAVISSINNWDDLYAFNFGDNFDNWQLLLRRNTKVQSFVCTLCDLTDEKTVVSDLSTMIKSVSDINGWTIEQSVIDKAKHIHSQLYQDANLQVWMQTKDAMKLKWSNNHIYIHRPRSWYDWVALDTYRNKIATELISKFGFESTNKCDNADFYWGPKFELNVSKTDFNITAEFDDIGDLKIGVKDDGKATLPINVSIQTIDIESDWLIRKRYCYQNVTSTTQVGVLINQIRDQIIDLTTEITPVELSFTDPVPLKNKS